MSLLSLTSNKPSNIKVLPAILIILIVALCWNLLPLCMTVRPEAFHMTLIFIATMAGIILEICHPIMWILFNICIASLTQTININMAFSGFANIVPWLLFAVLSLAKALSTGTLSLRIAYFFTKTFGGSLIGLSYSIVLSELLLSPVLPSNTARAASLGLPLTKSLSQYIHEHSPNISENSIGSYLTLLYSFSNAFTSGIFLTAMISNALITECLQGFGINLSWLEWAKYMIIPYFLTLAIFPPILLAICRIQINNLSSIKVLAAKQYQELGPITKKERFILSIFFSMLLLWIGADWLNIPILTTTLLGVFIFLCSGTLNIRDILSSYSTFNSVLILGFLISLVNCLSNFGVFEIANQFAATHLHDISPTVSFIVLASIYFYAQYFFTGESSKILAFYIPFLTTGGVLGIQSIPLAITLAAFSSASDILASYTCSTNITMNSTNYVSLKRWVSCGFIVSLVFLAVWFSYIFIFLYK